MPAQGADPGDETHETKTDLHVQIDLRGQPSSTQADQPNGERASNQVQEGSESSTLCLA